MHTAHDDDVRLRPCSPLGQGQAVAHKVGYVLHFAALVVMPQDDGVLLSLQFFDFFLDVSHNTL